MDLLRTHSSHTEVLARIWAELAPDKTLGLDKAVLKVALVECSNPPPEAPFMALVAEGSEGPAMALRFNSHNNTKVRLRTTNSVTLKRVLKVVLSTLTNVAAHIGDK